MKRTFIVSLALTLVMVSAATGWAQAKTDFSGSWTFDQTRSDPPAAGRRGGGAGGRGGGPGAPTLLTIVQTPAQITIDRAMGPSGTISGVYKLDGSESTNLMGDVFLSKSKVSWDGPRLVITTVKDMGLGPNGMMSENSKETLSMEGGVLTITSTTRVTPDGGPERTRKLVYTKKS
jgi:hypothetical protein